MPTTEELLREVMADNVSVEPQARPDRYAEVRHRVHIGRGRRAAAAVGATASVAAITVALVAQIGTAGQPAKIGIAGFGSSPTTVGPTLPPPPYTGSQDIALLSGVPHHWTDGTHSVTVTAGGTLAITTECYGAGTLSVRIGRVPAPLTTMLCTDAQGAGRQLQLATISPSDYATYGISPGGPVMISVTRSGGDSAQWRIEVLRNPHLAVPSSASSSS